MGKHAYADAEELFITADAGGSNSYRSHVWKHELQKIVDETHFKIRVSYFPPETSKWNKIEHRLFCHIAENWCGKPLCTIETIVDLIGNTWTVAGLRVKAVFRGNGIESFALRHPQGTSDRPTPVPPQCPHRNSKM